MTTNERPTGTDPTVEDDLAELEAYFQKGTAVSRAACGRMITTYRLTEARARTVGASNGHLRENVDQLRWEVGFLCDRILELRAFDADEDARETEERERRLIEERCELDQLNGRLLALLDGTVVALKGPHPERGLHDLSDVPVRAREAAEALARERRLAEHPVTELVDRLRTMAASAVLTERSADKMNPLLIDAAVALEIQQDNVDEVARLTDRVKELEDQVTALSEERDRST